MTLTFEDLAYHLKPVHVGNDGEPHDVDAEHPANAYTSQLMGVQEGYHALLLDIDSPVWAVQHGQFWLPAGVFPTINSTLLDLLCMLDVADGRGYIRPLFHARPSSTPGHQHVYIMAKLTWDELVLVHTALAYTGVQGFGNLFQVLKRGYSTLFFPGAKAKVPGAGSSGRGRPANVHILPMRPDWPRKQP